MDELINRRLLRRMIFMVRHNTKHILDKKEIELVEKVEQEFTGYLLGPIGWGDFTMKWDISPGHPTEAKDASRVKRTIADWGDSIINLWEWKDYLKDFKNIFGDQAIPPPCFTRQERLDK